VIYIDGLHTSLQTLRDFINATSFLKSNGVIVIDDVIPNSYHSSLSDHSASITLRKALGVADKSWMGDVYRVTFFLQTFFQQYRFATIQENHGQTVVWHDRRPATEIGHRTIEELGRLPFEATIQERTVYNMQPFNNIMEILSQHVRK
jgi:hypothetical protein